MDSNSQNETQDNHKKKKGVKSKLSALKYGLKKKSDSEKDNKDKTLSTESVNEDTVACNSQEDVHSIEINSAKERKIKKNPTKKTYSFIKRFKLGKSPIGTRGKSKRIIAEPEMSSEMSSVSATSVPKNLSNEKSDITDMSETNTISVEGETIDCKTQADSNTSIITIASPSATFFDKKPKVTEPEEACEKTIEISEAITEKTLEENKSTVKNINQQSGTIEIIEHSKIETLSVTKTTDKNSEVVELRTTFSNANLPDTENSKSVENIKIKEATSKVIAIETMPAFSDLIIDGSQDNSQQTSNVTQFGQERREHLYKLLVIGELGTGKTSIIKRYVHQFFSQHYRATIGVDFALKVLNWDANTIIRLQLWDIAGQERFGNMTRVYYKDAVGAFIVFDATRVATFDAVVKWKQDLDSKVQLPDGSPIPCVLLGNKCDQQKEGLINIPSRMEEYCKEKGFAGWFETSAKENINIEEGARFLVNKILLNDKLLCSKEANKDNERIAIDGKGENNKHKSENLKTCSC